MDRRAKLSIGAGEALVTLGVVVVLFCVYQLAWTNLQASAATESATSDLRAQWAADEPDPEPERIPPGQPLILPTPSPPPAPPPPPPPPAPPPVPAGAFAFMHIPRLGDGWYRPIVQGVRDSDLNKGLGHYKKTAMPGEIGNFAVAGHRATNGEPFRDLDKLRKGDVVVVETKKTWYTYRMQSSQIVSPNQSEVLLPVPGQPGAAPDQARITLTTCHPRWASTQRLIWFGSLVRSQPKAAGAPAGITPAATGG